MGKVKILCFGDSLTEGYSKWGLLYTPYAKSLEEKLKAAWPNTGIEIEVDGVSGDCVIPAYGDFLDRITADCRFLLLSLMRSSQTSRVGKTQTISRVVFH